MEAEDKVLYENIEKLRNELYRLYENEGSIQSNKMLEISRKLDELILEDQKKFKQKK